MEKVRCPRCREWANWKGNSFRPFCGQKCKENDLGRWASEDYKIPVEELDSGLDLEEELKKQKKGPG